MHGRLCFDDDDDKDFFHIFLLRFSINIYYFNKCLFIFSRTNILPLPTFISPFHSTSCVERDSFFMYLSWIWGFVIVCTRYSLFHFSFQSIFVPVPCSLFPYAGRYYDNISNFYCYPVSAIPMIMSSSIWFALDVVVIWNIL